MPVSSDWVNITCSIQALPSTRYLNHFIFIYLVAMGAISFAQFFNIYEWILSGPLALLVPYSVNWCWIPATENVILDMVGKGFSRLSHSFIEGIFVKFSLVKSDWKELFNALALSIVSPTRAIWAKCLNCLSNNCKYTVFLPKREKNTVYLHRFTQMYKECCSLTLLTSFDPSFRAKIQLGRIQNRMNFLHYLTHLNSLCRLASCKSK